MKSMQHLKLIFQVIPVSTYLVLSAVRNRLITLREAISVLRLVYSEYFSVKNPPSGSPSVYSAVKLRPTALRLFSPVNLKTQHRKLNTVFPRHRQRTLV